MHMKTLIIKDQYTETRTQLSKINKILAATIIALFSTSTSAKDVDTWESGSVRMYANDGMTAKGNHPIKLERGTHGLPTLTIHSSPRVKCSDKLINSFKVLEFDGTWVQVVVECKSKSKGFTARPKTKKGVEFVNNIFKKSKGMVSIRFSKDQPTKYFIPSYGFTNHYRKVQADIAFNDSAL